MTSASPDLSGRATALQARIDQLAMVSDEPGRLTRLFLSPAHRQANDLVRRWMEEAGMDARIDAAANVVGVYPGSRPAHAPLMLASHIDTVRDAGRYDGALGVLAAISVVDRLHREGRRLPSPVCVVAFGDEEGVRFGSTMLGSRAVAGQTVESDLDRTDDDGLSVRAAMIEAGLDPAGFAGASMAATPPSGYLELHIEQGPVLERAGLTLAAVSAITGSFRLSVEVAGTAGHAGTVPMGGRRDALAAAAACIVCVELVCRRRDIVGTVGQIAVAPNASNVIAGACRFSVDVRSADDAVLAEVRSELLDAFAAIALERTVGIVPVTTGGAVATACDPAMIRLTREAIGFPDSQALVLVSGAGHDGIAMSRIAPIGMIFVRCAGGVSHHPSESVAIDDLAEALEALDRFVETYDDDAPARSRQELAQ